MGACCSTDAVATAKTTDNSNPVAVADDRLLEEVEGGIPAPTPSPDATRACFGAGCYWGTEKYFYHDFGKKNLTGAITDGRVGFMGPDHAPKDPTYKEVKGGYTSHVEVFEFEYSGGRAYYEALVRFFFQFHDPTTLKRQGNDIGTQYASVIYCYDQAQTDIANKVKAELQQLLDAGKITCFEGKTVTTEIRPATVFYTAHPEHQDYLTVNPDGYCNHRIRFPEWPSLESAPEVAAPDVAAPEVAAPEVAAPEVAAPEVAAPEVAAPEAAASEPVAAPATTTTTEAAESSTAESATENTPLVE